VVPERSVSTADVVVGVAVLGRDVAVTAVRGTRKALRPVGEAMLRPPLVPERVQPASLLSRVGRSGRAGRQAVAQLGRARLTDLVLRFVDVDEVVASVDLDAIVDRLDLVARAEQVIDAVDLPEIIRESTGAMTSDTVRGARMQGIAADEAVGRAMDRLLPRRRRGDA
jgi:hypothetical protein